MRRKGKIRTGFTGEKRISLPLKALKIVLDEHLYINHIGYYPKAYNHYRRRKYGCEDNILIYCLQGKGYCVLDGVKHEVRANQYIIIPSTTKPLSYWADMDDPWTIYWLHFTGSDLLTFNKKYQIKMDNPPVYIPYNTEGILIWNKIYDSLSLGLSLSNMLNANLCLSHFLATFLFPQHHNLKYMENEDNDMINQIVDYMKDNLKKKLTVQEIASLYNFSESYFSKLFRTSTGMSPMDYFIHLKMQEACKMLCDTTLQIKYIAHSMGYDDPYYFSRIFKKTMNMSPQNYRESMLKILDNNK